MRGIIRKQTLLLVLL